MDKDKPYWSGLVKQLRKTLNAGQEELAVLLNLDQGTISRWERGLTTPGYTARRTLERMAKDAGLATLDEIVAFVRASPFPILLVNRRLRIVAASASSGFTEGLTCTEQAPDDERPWLEAFMREMEAQRFWDHRCGRLDYQFDACGQQRSAIVMPVTIRGEIYGLVQKSW